MWLFDSILLNRIRDLERTVEVLTGANQVLSQQLERSQMNEVNLQNKIFDITGVNRFNGNHSKDETRSTEPIRLTNRPRSWPEVRQTLEVKSKEQYWQNKKDKMDKRKLSSPEEIEQLEKDIIGDKDER